VHVFNVILANLAASVHLAHLVGRREELNGVAQRGAGPDLAETCEGVLLQLQSLGLGAQLDYLLHVGGGVKQSADNQQTIEQIQRNAVRRDDVSGATRKREK